MNHIEVKSDSDITIHSGPDIDNNVDDSPLPRACKEPLAIRTQRRIEDSKIQSQRIRKNCERQQQQYMIRLAGWMFQEGQKGRLSKEAVDNFVSKHINLAALDMTLTKAVQHLSKHLAFSYLALGAFTVDNLVNHFNNLLYCAIEGDSSIFEEREEGETEEEDDDNDDKDDGAQQEEEEEEEDDDMIVNIVNVTNVCDKVVDQIRQIADYVWCRKLLNFVLMEQVNVDFHATLGLHLKGEFSVSESLLQVCICICLTLLSNNIASRVYLGSDKKRAMHEARTLELHDNVKQWLVNSINDKRSIIHSILFVNNDIGDDFDICNDSEICMSDIDEDAKIQHQCAQSVLAIEAFMVVLIPILPSLVSTSFIWDFSCLGKGLHDFKTSLDLLISMNYWGVANAKPDYTPTTPIPTPSLSRTSKSRKSKRSRKMKNKKQTKGRKDAKLKNVPHASKSECIQHKQTLAWSIFIYQICKRGITGDHIMDPVFSPNQSLNPYAYPLSGALKLYSQKHISRTLKNIVLEFKGKDVPTQKLIFNQKVAEICGDDAVLPFVNWVEFDKFWCKLKDELVYGGFAPRHLIKYDKTFAEGLKMWKSEKVFENRWNGESNLKSKNCKMVYNGVSFPDQWWYDHQVQAELCESFAYRNCVNLMKKFYIPCVQDVKHEDLMREDADAAGFTDAENEHEQSNNVDDQSFAMQDGNDEERDDQLLLGIGNLNINVSHGSNSNNNRNVTFVDNNESSDEPFITGFGGYRDNKSKSKSNSNSNSNGTGTKSFNASKFERKRQQVPTPIKTTTSHVNLQMNVNKCKKKGSSIKRTMKQSFDENETGGSTPVNKRRKISVQSKQKCASPQTARSKKQGKKNAKNSKQKSRK